MQEIKLDLNNTYKIITSYEKHNFSEIFEEMKNSKEKGYKIILKKNLQSILLVNINSRGIFNNNLEGDFVYRTKLSVNSLITNILFQEGNRAKIKLRNFFYRNNKNGKKEGKYFLLNKMLM